MVAKNLEACLCYVVLEHFSADGKLIIYHLNAYLRIAADCLASACSKSLFQQFLQPKDKWIWTRISRSRDDDTDHDATATNRSFCTTEVGLSEIKEDKEGF